MGNDAVANWRRFGPGRGTFETSDVDARIAQGFKLFPYARDRGATR